MATLSECCVAIDGELLRVSWTEVYLSGRKRARKLMESRPHVSSRGLFDISLRKSWGTVEWLKTQIVDLVFIAIGI